MVGEVDGWFYGHILLLIAELIVLSIQKSLLGSL